MEKYPGFKLHQIGPYLGKIKPSLARLLINKYSTPGETIVDPFCGSGTIPLEASLLGRNAIGLDINPYAIALTKAKLFYPTSVDETVSYLYTIKEKLEANIELPKYNIPDWVKVFYHEKTLNETIFILDQLKKDNQFFLIGCVLSILHHQRPGFLSFPASNLVPYLRDKKFPKELFPTMYEYREPFVKIEAKIRRALDPLPPEINNKKEVYLSSAKNLAQHVNSIDSIITSPPYMDTLDYLRDNRLRLWFIGCNEFEDIKNEEIRNSVNYYENMKDILDVFYHSLKPGGLCVLVIGTTINESKKSKSLSDGLFDVIKKINNKFNIIDHWSQSIPDKNRSRRNCGAVKEETIIALKKI